MAEIHLVMPEMGESVTDATISNWLVKEGDRVEVDQDILEVATDKVDTEVPSPAAGVIKKIIHQEGDVVDVGKPLAIIEVEGDVSDVQASPAVESAENHEHGTDEKSQQEESGRVTEDELKHPTPPFVPEKNHSKDESSAISATEDGNFYSPLVRNIARKEGISMSELKQVQGSGLNGRVTKDDILAYLEDRKNGATNSQIQQQSTSQAAQQQMAPSAAPKPQSSMPGEVVEMDRMRKLIADHMVVSKKTSPHVTLFIEADVTNLVQWRSKMKTKFYDREGEKLTFTPLFVHAVTNALKAFPKVNASIVDQYKIHYKKPINIGMATALPNGNLIVPVIKNCADKTISALAKDVNDLATRARNNQLKPDDAQGGTFTLTNIGTFDNLMGTPIINQPQSAILATGAIQKKPVVLETDGGDVIGIRQMMYLSLAMDHRIIDGALGGAFLKRVKDELEQWDTEQDV